MQRRVFLRSGLALGAVALLSGTGLSANNRFASDAEVQADKMTFAELLRSEEELLEMLLADLQRPLTFVEEGNVTALIQHLEVRQQLWNEFEFLEQQLAPHKRVPAAKRCWKSVEERKRTEAALHRCEELLGKIREKEQICLAKTAMQKEELEKQWEKLRKVGTEFQVTEMAKNNLKLNTAVSIMRHQMFCLSYVYFVLQNGTGRGKGK